MIKVLILSIRKCIEFFNFIEINLLKNENK